MDGPPPERETPLPCELGGRRENGAEVSLDTALDTRADSTTVVDEYRARRFAAQRAVALTCRADALANFPGRYPSDVYRVIACMWCSSGGIVSVIKSIEFNRAHYRGLQTCGSVWLCPCCASKIEERRRMEIVQVFAWADSQGMDSSLITNTFSHGQGDNLRELFQRQSAALKIYRDAIAYRREMKRIGYVAMVRGLEITHGRNGFHPHTHEVQFHRETLTEDDAKWMRFRLAEIWIVACTKAGLFNPATDDEIAFMQRSLNVRHNFTAGNYLAKQDDEKAWTPAHEISKASSKEGRHSGVHPFQLASRGNPGDPDLFIEYARATKGKRKLMFSPGLKAKAGLHEVTDEQIAAQEIDKAKHVADLVAPVWNFIRTTDRRNNTRAAVLAAAESDGVDGIARLLQTLGFDPHV